MRAMRRRPAASTQPSPERCETFPAQPSPPLLFPPSTEPWGWGAGTCRESKTRGWRRAGKGSSHQAAFPWAPQLRSPKMLRSKGATLGTSWCWPKVLWLLLAHLYDAKVGDKGVAKGFGCPQKG